MSIKSKDITLVDIDAITPHPKNNNRHSIEQIKRLSKLIKHNGFRVPLIISNLSGFLIAGHGRLDAAKGLKMTEVPVIYQDFKNEAEEYQFLTADNTIQAWSELDMQAVHDFLEDMPDDFDTELLGIDGFEHDIEVLDPQADEDTVPELQPDPIAKRGDVWLLGNHRLMCGDSTMIDDVEKLMNGEKADMVFTDPPYGVSYTGGFSDNGDGLKANKREMLINDDIDLYEDVVSMANTFSNGVVFMFFSDSVPFGLYRGLENVDADIVAHLIWKKKGGYAAMNASYKSNYEPCVIWKPKGKKLNFIGDTTENRVWEIEKDGVNKMHPTQKPVDIPKRAISNHDAKIVLDFFGGSGSTMIACEIVGRVNRSMELDEKYCDVIIKRWQDYTGKEATLEITGETYNSMVVTDA